ncbi:MAG TPA: GNAT family N-acetyltransferase [Fimbriimonadaceae bacterium]|nr:GNAT family N-acetyltransferase [Fimbriimonadaceae bacterium]
MLHFLVRPMRDSDVGQAAALQRSCFPAPFPEELLWTEEHLRRHIELFPEGQFVALGEVGVIGSASNCIVSENAWFAHRSWDETVGGPMLRNHDRMGSTLYGLDISVHPDCRGSGVMRALYSARFELVEELGLARYGTAVRIPGFADYELQNSGVSPEDYVQAVVDGRAADRTLTPMLRVGLRPVGVIRDYMEDPESHNCAAVLEWHR